MVADPPDCMDIRQVNSEVAVICLPQKHQSSGKKHGHWFARLRPAVKNKPSCVVRKVIHLRKAGVCLGSSQEDKGSQEPEMLCKTIIGLGSELVRVPNVATANETGNNGGFC
jgi:hypothetical protein